MLRLVFALALFGCWRSTPVTQPPPSNTEGRLVGRVSYAGRPTPNYELVVYDASGKEVVSSITTQPDGTFAMILVEGTYVVYTPARTELKVTGNRIEVVELEVGVTAP